MSVEELKIYPSAITMLTIKYSDVTKQFGVRVLDSTDDAKIILDRSQAHLLMLYLQEHLNELEGAWK